MTIEKRMDILEQAINKALLGLRKNQERRDNFLLENNMRSAEIVQGMIDKQMQTLKQYQSDVSYLREDTAEDLSNRKDLFENYAKKVKDVIPDGEPVVFHGVTKLNVVEEIIKSGGLFTPEQRGVEMKSFASQIDVTYKDNITVSLEFADRDYNTMLPYGAIFAFSPKEDEVENVISTGSSTEVYGGVDGVDFRQEPDRLVSIITTEENIERIRDWCKMYGLPEESVCSHNQFLELCQEKYHGAEDAKSLTD